MCKHRGQVVCISKLHVVDVFPYSQGEHVSEIHLTQAMLHVFVFSLPSWKASEIGWFWLWYSTTVLHWSTMKHLLAAFALALCEPSTRLNGISDTVLNVTCNTIHWNDMILPGVQSDVLCCYFSLLCSWNDRAFNVGTVTRHRSGYCGLLGCCCGKFHVTPQQTTCLRLTTNSQLQKECHQQQHGLG